MKFQVIEGQSVTQLVTSPGSAVRVVRTAGEILEGPPWWVEEFHGRLRPLDEDGRPLPTDDLQRLSGDLATAKAHEKVGLLEDMIRKNPGVVADALGPELAKAKAEADAAVKDFEAKRAARAAVKPEAATIRRVSGPTSTGPSPTPAPVPTAPLPPRS